MASILQLWPPFSILFLFSSLLSFASSSSSPERRLLQSNSPSPQNIETFFPSFPSPAFTTPIPPPLPPPFQPSISSPPTPIRNSGDNKKITIAVVTTAIISFAISALLFFIFQLFSIKKRRQAKVDDSQKSFRRQNNPLRSKTEGEAALKGMIVDENGLDVLYLRNLDGGSWSTMRCDYCNGVLDRQDENSGSDHKRDDPRVQEVPLIPSNSINSSSHASMVSKRSSSTLFGITPVAPPSTPVPPPQPPPPKSTPPPPPPTPPPPPRPPVIKKNSSPTPPTPPRPPSAASKIPAAVPPPPPPVGGGASSSRPPPMPGPSAGEGGSSRTKLKPLHWDKVTPGNAEHSMVWDKMNDGSFRFDDELMEALFGYAATSRKSPNSSKNLSNPFSSPSNSSGPSSQICLLEPRKSQNIAIVLRSLAISRQEILDSLLEGRGLSHDALEKLTKMAPTKEEENKILEFTSNPSKLADAESFLYHLLRAVPSPFARLDAMLFKSSYDSEILHLKKSLQILELACKELKTRGLFLKLLEAILKAGNRMNAGTARGNAKAFNLTALCKLSDVKSTDGKTTLLHFVVEEVVRSEGKRLVINRNHSIRRSSSSNSNNTSGHHPNPGMTKTKREEKEKEYMMLGLPVVGGLSEELANVKKAATIDYNVLTGSCSSLDARISEIQQFLSGCNSSDGFVQEMKGFVQAAEEELKVVREEQIRVMELVKRITEYYQPGASKDKNTQPLQLFVIVRDFCGMFDRVCIEITRNMQKKPVARGVNSPKAMVERERRPVARFPNLPANFMLENSKSSSGSDSEDGF